MGVAAVTGIIFRKLDIVDGDIKNSLSGFEGGCHSRAGHGHGEDARTAIP